MELTVTPLTHHGTVKHTRWPFASLTVGTEFIVPTSESHRYHACRAAVSRYNKIHKTDIKCKQLGDGSMKVYRPAKDGFVPEPVKVTTVTPVPAPERPSCDELKEYVLSLKSGQSVTLGFEYESRFDELQEAIEHLNWPDQPLIVDYDVYVGKGLVIVRM